MSEPRDQDWPEHTHLFQGTKACPTLGYGKQARIFAHAELHYLKGNSRPYFAVGAEIWPSLKSRDCAACGCLHEEVLKYWPQLAPVVAMHLSSDNGIPMYAIENGWYWLCGYIVGHEGEPYHGGNSQGHYGGEYRYPTAEECLTVFANHVRVSEETARILCASLMRTHSTPQARKTAFSEWIIEQEPRWKAEADAAIQLLDSLIEKAKGVPA